MRLHYITVAALLTATIAASCGGGGGGGPASPADIPLIDDQSGEDWTEEPVTRSGSEIVGCVTADPNANTVFDSADSATSVVFSGLDPAANYSLSVAGLASTTASTAGKFRFRHVAVGFQLTSGGGRLEAVAVGGTLPIKQPRGAIGVTLIDPDSTAANDNSGSLTLTLTDDSGATGPFVQSLDPKVHVHGVTGAAPLAGLLPGVRHRLTHENGERAPYFDSDFHSYETALVAYNQSGLRLAEIALTKATATLITMGATSTTAYVLFGEFDGGTPKDNGGTTEICADTAPKGDRRITLDGHMAYDQVQSGRTFTVAANQSSTVRWERGLPLAAAGTRFQHLALRWMDAGDNQQVRLIKKGQSVVIDALDAPLTVSAGFYDHGTLSDNSVQAKLRVTDPGGRNNLFAVHPESHCVLLSPSVVASPPAVSLTPSVRNRFSWAYGEAYYQPQISPISTFPFLSGYLVTTTNAGRGIFVLPAHSSTITSLSVTPSVSEGYMFFLDRNTPNTNSGQIGVRQAF